MRTPSQTSESEAADNDFIGDPVDAYDRIAPIYRDLAEQRRAYLDAVDDLVVRSIRPGSRSILDVGSGDGARARRIARAAGLSELTLVEPSEGMRGTQGTTEEFWAIRAEALHQRQGSFDVVTCLWNVLGHVFPASARAEALRQLGRLLSPSGRIFIDLNHRYNAAQYGIWNTALRVVRDRLLPGEKNGDVRVTWDIGGTRCSTAGHVFTDREFRSLCRSAGLTIEERYVVDYGTGKQRRWAAQGHLLYVLSIEGLAVESAGRPIGRKSRS